ncbi:MAG: hypothetical protein JSW73_04195 [Candidatus Woesearchaeota archaeon]|nr:MAG: hypothetical protein JSW73_04195 [Candidatus Woesearchaeota archaeon]
MINEKILEEIGLTKLEAKVYLAILEQGSALASVISRRSGIHRRCVYDAVERLIKKGLATYIVKNNRKHYYVTHPSRLLTEIKDKEDKLNQIIPDLIKKFDISKSRPETSFYQGMVGLKIIYEDMVKTGEEILVIGATTYSDVNRFFFPPFDIKRKKQNQKIRILFPESKRKKYDIPLSKIRYLPDSYISTVATNIYGDNIAISLWTKNPISILIHHKDIAKSYRNQFEILWKLAKD